MSPLLHIRSAADVLRRNTADVAQHAAKLRAAGFGHFDALHIACAAARTWLTNAKAQSAAGAAEAVALAEHWRARMTVLIRRWSSGALSLEDFGRAVESEKEALAFNLAALANEAKRKFLAGLLGASLDFLGRIIGAATGALQ